MAKVRFRIAMSLDGFVARSRPERDADPIGIGGMRLHEWSSRSPPGGRCRAWRGGEVGNGEHAHRRGIGRQRRRAR